MSGYEQHADASRGPRIEGGRDRDLPAAFRGGPGHPLSAERADWMRGQLRQWSADNAHRQLAERDGRMLVALYQAELAQLKRETP